MINKFLPVVVAFLCITSPIGAQTAASIKAAAGRVLQEKGPPIFSAALSKDGKFLAIGSVDGTLQLFETATGDKKFTRKDHRAPVTAVAFTPDGKQLVSAGIDKAVRIWNLADGTEAGSIHGFELAVLSLSLSPDGKTLLAGTGQWNKVTQPEIHVIDFPARKRLTAVTVSDRLNRGADVAALTFAPDGKTFAAAIRGNGLQQWDLAKRERTSIVYGPRGQPVSVAISPDGLNAAAGMVFGDILLVDTRNWKQLARLQSPGDVTFVSFSADGRTLASASRDGTAKLWDVSTLEVPAPITIRSGPGPATVALFAPQGKTLAVAGFDGKLQLHEVSRSETPVVNLEPVIPARGQRVAVVGTDQAVRNLLALAEAKLTGQVQLVERRQLDAILAEQRLSLAGFVKHDQIVQVGKLLGVDAFAVVESDKVNKQAVGLVVFNAQTGVRLWDATLPASGIEAAAEAVAHGVRSALNKHHDRNLATICLTTVRNADLPRSQDALCDLVGHLLERGLLAAPNLAVLERTRLDQIARERNLPTDSPVGQVLASLVRIELEVGKSPDGQGLRGTVFLLNNRGQELGKAAATVDRRDAEMLAAALLGEAARPLKARPGAIIVDRVREVIRLNAEAEFFQEHKDWNRALKLRQAASALMPNDLTLRAQLAETAVESGRAVHHFVSHRPVSFFDQTPSEDLQRSLELVRQAIEALIEVESKRADNEQHRPAMSAWYNIISYLDGVTRLRVDAPTLALVEQVQESNLALQQLRHDRAVRLVKDRDGYEFYTTCLGNPPHNLYFDRSLGLTDRQLATFRSAVLTRWLDLAEKWGAPPVSFGALRSSFHLLRGLKALGNDRAQKYRQVLLNTGDPFALLYDRHADFLLGIDKLSEMEKQKRVQDYRLFAQKVLQSDQAHRDLIRFEAYRTAAEGIDLLTSLGGFTEPGGREYLALCRFMMEQKDVMPKVIESTLNAGRSSSHEARGAESARFGLIEQVLGYMDSGRFLGDEITSHNPEFAAHLRENLKKGLLEQRQQIAAQYPDLDRKVVQPWTKLSALMDVADSKSGALRLLQPVVDGDAVYVLAMSQDSYLATPYFELLRLSLSGAEPTRVGKLHSKHRFNLFSTPPKQTLSARSQFAAGACIHDGRFILGTKRQGFMVFSLDRPEATVLNVDSGLPSDHVQQLVCMNGKIYAGLGEPGKEGYLIAHDLKTGRTEVLASSRRKDSQSPLDNTTPLQVSALQVDAKRNRVLAYIWVGFDEQRKLNGLWEIDARSGRLKQLHNLVVRFTTTPFDLEWASPILNDKIVLALRDSTCLVDLETNQLKRRPQVESTNRLASYLEPRLNVLNEFLQPGERTFTVRHGDFVHKGWLYTSYPFGRISLDGKTKEAFPNLRADHTSTFRPWENFQVVGNRALIADQLGIWLADLP